MKRLLSLFMTLVLIFLSCLVSNAEPELGLSATSAVLIEAESGRIIYSKNCDQQLSMASTTKIMTSLIAVEYGNPDMEIKVNPEWVKVEGTSMGLKADDTVTLEGLICGMLMTSGNDAANVTAYTLGGSIEKFAEIMNTRAKEIGMENTNFVTPSGLDDENHYSTAYDMALLGAEAIKNEKFRGYCSSEGLYAYYGNPPYRRYLSNHNKLLNMYEGAIGIKTGFTKKSGRCLVSAVERDGIILVAVTLNAPDDWNDHIKLFDYGFSSVKKVSLDTSFDGIYINITGGVYDKVQVAASESAETVIIGSSEPQVERKIYLKKFEYAPVSTDCLVGEAFYYIDGELVYRLGLYPYSDVATNPNMKTDKERFWELIKNIVTVLFCRT